MVETVGTAPTATILQGSSAPLCCPHGARDSNRTNLFCSSGRRVDHDHYAGKELERTMGIEPTTSTLARSHSTPELHPHKSKWWAGADSNCHSKCGAFTAPWAHQCSAYPIFFVFCNLVFLQ